jgi:hypothetical protein
MVKIAYKETNLPALKSAMVSFRVLQRTAQLSGLFGVLDRRTLKIAGSLALDCHPVSRKGETTHVRHVWNKHVLGRLSLDKQRKQSSAFFYYLLMV